MSGYLSIRFELIWAFSPDGPFVQILDHVYMCISLMRHEHYINRIASRRGIRVYIHDTVVYSLTSFVLIIKIKYVNKYPTLLFKYILVYMSKHSVTTIRGTDSRFSS